MKINSQIPQDASPSLRSNILEGTCITHDGNRISPKQDRFISLYIKYSDPGRAAEEAGYAIRDSRKDTKAAYARKGKELLMNDVIRNEISARMDDIRCSEIADAKEVLIYLTKVMRGEVKDQFDLDAPLQERTAAAKELNRRLREMEQDKEFGSTGKEVHLVLRRE